MTVVAYDTQVTANVVEGSSVVVAKPTGLAVGDLLVAFIGVNRHASVNLNTPSGWSAISPLTGAGYADVSTYHHTGCFFKVADVGDVTADDFTFTANSALYYLCGVLIGITGATTVESAARGRFQGTTSPVTLTGGVPIAGGGRLVLVCGGYNAQGGVTAINAPALATDNPEWTTLVPATALYQNKFRVDAALRIADTATGNIAQAVTYTPAGANLYGEMAAITIRPDAVGEANGNIALMGAADLFTWTPVAPVSAIGTIQIAGSAALSWRGDQYLSADGTLALSGPADLSMATYLAASGSLALAGEAWLAAVAHGDDTMAAVGTIALCGTVLRLSTGETLPPTDNDGWTAPDVTIPDIRGLVVKVGGLSIKRAQITDLVIEMDTEGGPKSATLSVNCALTRAPRLMQTLEVTYKGQTLFPKKGRLEHIASNVDSSTGYTLTYAGPLVTLRDHKAFRCVYVDSDLQVWSTDQGPRTSPDTFEVASRSSGATV